MGSEGILMNRSTIELVAGHWAMGYVTAIASTGLVVCGRALLDPWLNEECPFSLFYLSVLLTAWISGSGPAILAIVLGTICAAYFFIEPEGDFSVDSAPEVVQLVMYVFVNCVATFLFDRMRRQRALAEQSSRDNEQLSQSLREADERKDEFLALLAHELRNPLAPIRSGMALLGRDPGSIETVRRVHQIVERQTSHLVRITDDLLDVSRFCQGKVELQVELIDLRDAVLDAIEMTEELMESRAHRFQRLLPDRAVWVEGDQVRLAQLTANLLSNAAKYTPPGGRIVLELEAGPKTTSIVVRDNGIGFPPEFARLLLQPFRQLDTSRTREYGGLGLGLTIVDRLAAMHRGVFEANSGGPGRGSCFTVRIPTAAPAEQTNAEASRAGTESADPLTDGDDVVERRDRRILIVEDGQDAAELLRDLFESEGYSVCLASDGVGALQQLSDHFPIVCVVDIGLPGMDGYELARRIRSTDHGSRARLIALTGWGSQSDREQSMQAGFDLHLVKPILFSELMHHVASAFDEEKGVSAAVPARVNGCMMA